MSRNAHEKHRIELGTSDHLPTCPRCQDLMPPLQKWCTTCDTWLLDRGPTATELRAHARLNQERYEHLTTPQLVEQAALDPWGWREGSELRRRREAGEDAQARKGTVN